MLDIQTETRAFIESALAGDPALVSLVVSGTSGADLAATMDKGRPPSTLDRVTYSPETPFLREQMLELVVRMQRSRWSRFDHYALALTPATDRDLDRLRDYDAMRYDTYSIHCECGPGWYDMLDATLSWIAEAQPNAWWKVSQLKEKFGGLRVYNTVGPGWISEILDAAEHLSEHVCDLCGAPGRKSTDRWITTRCEEHQQ